jgi:hypothetical protein
MFIRNENLKRKSLAKLVPRFHQNLNTPPERKILSNPWLLTGPAIIIRAYIKKKDYICKLNPPCV